MVSSWQGFGILLKQMKPYFLTSLWILFSALPAFAFQLNEKPSIQFELQNEMLEKGDVPIAFQSLVITPNQEPFKTYENILFSDNLSQVAEAERLLQSPPRDLRVRKILLVKSAFRLNKSIDDIKEMQLHKIASLQKGVGFEYDHSCSNLCQISEKVRYLLFSLTVTANLEVQFFSLAEATDDTKNLLKGLGVDQAAYELRMLGRKWSNIFTVSQSISYFIPRDAKTTDVITYQIMSIKEVSYGKLPNLDGIIKSVIKNQTQKLIEFFRSPSPGLGQRDPASSGYDKDLYEQTHYLLEDPAGDDALALRAGKVPKNIFSFLKKKSSGQKNSELDDWAPEDSELKDDLNIPFKNLTDPAQPIIQGRDNPLKVQELTKAFGQIIKEESLAHQLKPQFGKIHHWSMDSSQKQITSSYIMAFDKVFVALCLGFTNRFMKTEREEDLRTWMLAQSYNSITLPSLFQQSYILNEGDVYLTLLTIENVLASNWRFPGRENMPLTKRLKPIVSGYNYDVDRYGTWYHLFGMILFGYIKSGMTANLVGRVEALGSDVMAGFNVDKTQKQWMNKQGGFIGQNLKKLVLTGSWQQISMAPENLLEEQYLNRSEDFRDRLSYQLSSSVRAEAWGQLQTLETLRLTSLEKSLSKCHIDLIFDHGHGFDSRNKTSFNQQDLLKGQELILPLSKNPVKAVRVFIQECQNSEKSYVMETIL